MKTLSSSVESPRQRRRLQEDKSKEALSSTPSSPSSSSFTKEKRKKRRGIRFIAIVNSPRACHQHQQHQHQRLRSLSFTAFCKRLSSLRENNTTKTKSFTVLVSYLLFLSLVRFFFFQSGRPSKVAADAQKVGTETKNFDCNPKCIFFCPSPRGGKRKI